MIDFAAKCPRYDESPEQHSAVRVRAATVGTMQKFLAVIDACEHCGAPIDSFVAFVGDPNPAAADLGDPTPPPADIGDLLLSVRCDNSVRECLKVHGLPPTIEALIGLTERQLLNTRHLGGRSLSEIRTALSRRGLALRRETPK